MCKFVSATVGDKANITETGSILFKSVFQSIQSADVRIFGWNNFFDHGQGKLYRRVEGVVHVYNSIMRDSLWRSCVCWFKMTSRNSDRIIQVAKILSSIF